jgi:hypothetical protein
MTVYFKKLLSVLSCIILVLSCTSVSFGSQNKEFKSIDALATYAVESNSNIMLYDENGKIINEIHSDGVKVFFIYDPKTKRIKEIRNTNNVREILDYSSCDVDGTLTISIYYNNELVTNKFENDISEFLNKKTKIEANSDTTIIKKAAEGTLYQSNSISVPLENTLTATPTPTPYEDYIVNGRNMNSLCPSIWTVAVGQDKFGRNSSTNLTAAQIQSFLVNKNSVLQNQIEVWAKNSSGNVYDTGRRVYPNQVIDKASKDWCINPKVILATLQKEQGLISVIHPGDPNYPYSARAFYFAMGYGATDGGDINSYTGFDTQVDGGTHLFLTLWNEGYYKGVNGFPFKMTGINYGLIKTFNGVTYTNYIYIKDCGTYALYRYTPHTFDVKLTPAPYFDSGNYLLLTCMKVFWPGNSSSNYQGANWN